MSLKGARRSRHRPGRGRCVTLFTPHHWGAHAVADLLPARTQTSSLLRSLAEYLLRLEQNAGRNATPAQCFRSQQAFWQEGGFDRPFHSWCCSYCRKVGVFRFSVQLNPVQGDNGPPGSTAAAVAAVPSTQPRCTAAAALQPTFIRHCPCYSYCRSPSRSFGLSWGFVD